MGSVANAVKHSAGRVNSVAKPHTGVNNFVRNASSNMGQASKSCPILTEFSKMAQGVSQGDFQMTAVNTGILAFTATSSAASSKLMTQSSKGQTLKMAALCTGNQLFGSVGIPQNVRQYSQSRQFSSFQEAKLKPLPYPMNGLEPVITENLMNYHYGKHHQTYVNNFNALQEKAAKALEAGDHKTYTDLSQGIKFNGGGHMNHEFFWENLSPVNQKGGKLPNWDSDLHCAITKTFGSFEKFIAHFNANTAAVQGSGWGWLAYNKTSGDVEFRTTANQDRLVDQGAHLVPLLTVDIWEHAYYLDYQNVRPNFLKEVCSIMNWEKVEERLAEAKKA